MKKFIIKFLVAVAIALVPMLYFSFIVYPNASGDIGKLGLINFGKEYEGTDVEWYDRGLVSDAVVDNISYPDSIRNYEIITIGDSFCQQKELGFQTKLSSLCGKRIANLPNTKYSPEVGYIRLLNAGYFYEGQTVILESVERCLVSRFANLDFEQKYEDTSVFVKRELPHGGKTLFPSLNNFTSWIRLRLDINNPVLSYPLSKSCFTHPKYYHTLHCYMEDLIFQNINDNEYETAVSNIKLLKKISENKGINLILMVAADKYDVYEPWISTPHSINPTLDKVVADSVLVNTKEFLQQAVNDGVQDVYKLNNTHWSVVGADLVAKRLYECMLKKGFI